MTQDAAVATNTISINDRDVRADDPRIRNIVDLIALKSNEPDAYRPLLDAAVVAGEFTALAEMLLDIELEKAAVADARSFRQSEEITLCRDDVKTILISEIGPLHDGARSEVGATAPMARKPTIDLLANDLLFLVLGTGSIAFRHYVLSPAEPDGEPAGVALRDMGQVVYRPYEMFTVRRDVEALDVEVVDGGVWLLQLIINDHSPVLKHFDRSTLLPAGVSSANFHATRLEFVFELFKRLAHTRAVPAIESIQASSRFHFVRWKAAQTIIHLDTSSARRALDAAMEDEHPQVRNAAARTLANLTEHGII